MWQVIPLFVAVPLAGAFLLALIGRASRLITDVLSLLVTLFLLIGSVLALKKVHEGSVWVYAVGGWDPPWGIAMVLDGLSAFMLLTINTVAFLVAIYARRYLDAFTGRWQFDCLFLLMLAGMNGVVLSGDMFNLFVYLEVAAVASYALVAFGTEKHELEAAFKYAVMGSLGSLFILMAVVLLYSRTSTLTMADMAAQIQANGLGDLGGVVLGFLVLGFGLKAALVPFHAWLPDAHPSAPAPISAMLSGVLIKALGVYALVRVVFTVLGWNQTVSVLLLALGVLSMVVGAFLAAVQWDVKRMFAYSSISQVGYIVTAFGLGTPLGLAAGLFHLFNHSIFKSLLFLDSGCLEQATGTRDLRKMGGLGRRMPVTGTAAFVGAMSIAGVPPFNGFWSKLLIVLAAIEAGRYGIAVLAVAVSFITLGYFAKALRYAFMGRLPERYLSLRETGVPMQMALVTLSLVCLLGGALWLPEVRSWVLDPAVAVLQGGPAATADLLARFLP